MISFTLNGTEVSTDVDESEPILYVLRNDFQMNGPKFGCGLGQCGACSILIDGRTAFSCVTPVSAATGSDIRTLDGLKSDHSLHPVQGAFLKHQAAQCGYCTNGMIIRAVDLLSHSPQPAESEIREAFDGHLCRCGTHARIIEAVKSVRMERGVR